MGASSLQIRSATTALGRKRTNKFVQPLYHWRSAMLRCTKSGFAKKLCKMLLLKKLCIPIMPSCKNTTDQKNFRKFSKIVQKTLDAIRFYVIKSAPANENDSHLRIIKNRQKPV